MKRKAQVITISVFILIISSCSKSRPSIVTSTNPSTNTQTIQITYAPSLTPSSIPTNTTTPIPTEIATCPSTPKTLSYENGLTWTEVVIPDRQYSIVKTDVAFLKSCIDFPISDEHDEEIHGERIQGQNGSDLKLVIGDDLYETRFDSTLGCCEYDLLKNGVIIHRTNAPLITTDPNRGFWNIGGKLVWELLRNPPTIIVDGVDLNEKYHLDGSYYPYEVKGKLLYIAKKEETYQIIFDYEPIGPEFEDILRAYCCAGMSVIRGEGQYWFIGKHHGDRYIVLIQ